MTHTNRLGIGITLLMLVGAAGCARMGRTAVPVPIDGAQGLFNALIAVAPQYKTTHTGRQADHVTFRTQYGDWLTYRIERGGIFLDVLVAKAEGASSAQTRMRVEEVKRFGLQLVNKARNNAFNNAVFR